MTDDSRWCVWRTSLVPLPRRGQGSDYSSRKVFHHSAHMCHNQVVSFLKLGNVWSCLILATPAFLLDHSHTPPRQYPHRALQTSGGRSRARSRCAEDGVPLQSLIKKETSYDHHFHHHTHLEEVNFKNYSLFSCRVSKSVKKKKKKKKMFSTLSSLCLSPKP